MTLTCPRQKRGKEVQFLIQKMRLKRKYAFRCLISDVKKPAPSEESPEKKAEDIFKAALQSIRPHRRRS